MPRGNCACRWTKRACPWQHSCPTWWGFCADPVRNKDGIMNLGFNMEVKEDTSRVVHVAHDLDVARPLTTSDLVPVKTEMQASKKGSSAPKHAGPQHKRKFKP